jgi:hypothetical protein
MLNPSSGLQIAMPAWTMEIRGKPFASNGYIGDTPAYLAESQLQH